MTNYLLGFLLASEATSAQQVMPWYTELSSTDESIAEFAELILVSVHWSTTTLSALQHSGTNLKQDLVPTVY